MANKIRNSGSSSCACSKQSSTDIAIDNNQFCDNNALLLVLYSPEEKCNLSYPPTYLINLNRS